METTAADLFERQHVAIFRFFRRVTGNPDLAEDLTQEVFVRVVKAAGWTSRRACLDHAPHPLAGADVVSGLTTPLAIGTTMATLGSGAALRACEPIGSRRLST